MITYQSTYISYLDMLCYARIETMNFFVGHQILMPQLDCQVWFSLNTEYTYYVLQGRFVVVVVVVWLATTTLRQRIDFSGFGLSFVSFLPLYFFTAVHSGWFHNGATSFFM